MTYHLVGILQRFKGLFILFCVLILPFIDKKVTYIVTVVFTVAYATFVEKGIKQQSEKQSQLSTCNNTTQKGDQKNKKVTPTSSASFLDLSFLSFLNQKMKISENLTVEIDVNNFIIEFLIICAINIPFLRNTSNLAQIYGLLNSVARLGIMHLLSQIDVMFWICESCYVLAVMISTMMSKSDFLDYWKTDLSLEIPDFSPIIMSFIFG